MSGLKNKEVIAGNKNRYVYVESKSYEENLTALYADTELSEEDKFVLVFKLRLHERIKLAEEVEGTLSAAVIHKKAFGGSNTPTPRTVSNIIDPNNRSTPDLHSVIKICKYLRINLNDIFTMPEMDSAGPFKINRLNDSIYEPFEDEAYLGEFHCYMFRSSYTELQNKTCEIPIVHAKLTMEKSDGGPTAKMHIYEEGEKFGKKKEKQPDRELKGSPFIYKSVSNVYIPMVSQYNTAYIMAFSYESFKRDVMYYRDGLFLSVNPNIKGKYPQFQKVVIFRNEIDLEKDHNRQIIKGILTMNYENTVILKSRYEELFEKVNSDALTKFRERYQQKLDLHCESCYVFNEDSVLYDNYGNLTEQEKKEALLLIRQESFSPKMLNIGYDKGSSSFGRNFQEEACIRKKETEKQDPVMQERLSIKQLYNCLVENGREMEFVKALGKPEEFEKLCTEFGIENNENN